MTDAQRDKIRKEIELPCYLNLAACDIKNKQYHSVIEATTKALEIDHESCKGLWRRGLALTETGNWIDAEKDLKRALDLAGSATEKKTVYQSYIQLKKLMAEQDRKDKEKFRKLFIDPIKFYEDLFKEIESVITGETDLFANAANVASVLFEQLNKIKQNKLNWVGFYWLENDGQLVLGPFQGKMACTRIDRGKGVCGAAVDKKTTMLVPDVHKFVNHIACDSASNSELVIPIIVKGAVVGVLDLDSVIVDGFDQNDKDGLEKIVRLLETTLKWDQLARHTRKLKARRSPSRSFYFMKIGLVILGMAVGTFCLAKFAPSFMNDRGKGSAYVPILPHKTLK